jgi:hypothetical protein
MAGTPASPATCLADKAAKSCAPRHRARLLQKSPTTTQPFTNNQAAVFLLNNIIMYDPRRAILVLSSDLAAIVIFA